LTNVTAAPLAVRDAWAALPASVRRDLLAAGAQSWSRVFAGRASVNPTWRLARPPMLSAAGLAALAEAADRMAELILDACRRRAGTAGELRRRLGVPAGEIRLLDEAEPLTPRLLDAFRPDVLFHGGQPRFVEFNVDSAVGLAFDADVVAQRFLAVYRNWELADRAGVRASPSAVDGRFAAVRTALGLPDGAHVAMLMDLDSGYPGMADPDGFLANLASVAVGARRFGLDLTPYPVGWLRLDGGRLLAADRPVDGVFRIFAPDVVPPGPGLAALAEAVTAGGVPMFTPTATWLLGNKLVLAWLWQDADGLPAADRDLVHRHLPRTVVLNAAALDRAVAGRSWLVAKPAGGSSGAGVLIGRDLDERQWRDGLELAVAGGRHVLQEYVDADPIAMEFVHVETGQIVTEEVPYSVAPYAFGRRPSGACARIGFPGGGRVLNLARGMLVSGVLIVSS
jgi:hypothetical protein